MSKKLSIGEFKPKRKNYQGKIYLLIGGGTFSAAVEFCTTLRKYQRATFIGEETGGNPIIMSGNYLKESRTLKNTGIEHYSGIVATIYDKLELNNRRGVISDYPVYAQMEDINSTTDRCVEKAVSIILNNE